MLSRLMAEAGFTVRVWGFGGLGFGVLGFRIQANIAYEKSQENRL